MRLTDTALRVERTGTEMVQARQVQDTILYATDIESVWSRSEQRGRKRGGKGRGSPLCGEIPHRPTASCVVGGMRGWHYDTPPSGRWSLVKKRTLCVKSVDKFNTRV